MSADVEEVRNAKLYGEDGVLGKFSDFRFEQAFVHNSELAAKSDAVLNLGLAT